MRRAFILALLATVVALASTGIASAGEGDPGDYCSHSPDRPLGWRFTPACQVHDECLADSSIPAQATACDDAFLDDLLLTSHSGLERACGEHLVCRIVARTYYVVVRYLTTQFAPAPPAEGSTGLAGAW